jgi:putative ABC transport system permease protein
MGLSQKISSIREYVEEVLKILYYYRGRVVFSFSGIALGILSICIIITTIEGANKKAYQIFEALGPDSLMIFSGSERQRQARERANTITLDDADSLATVGGVYDMMKGLSVRGITVQQRNRKWSTQIIGATENYFTSMSWKMALGTVFTENDVEAATPVAVLGWKVYDELFPGGDAIGKTILVGKLPTTVVGVLEERGGAFGGSHIDDRIIMPLTAVMGRVSSERKYLTLVRLRSNRDVNETIEDVKTLLRQNHKIADGGEDDFMVRSAKDVLQFLSVISGSLFLFLGTASVVALVVSGFVLANLFYLSIQERKKDIGIRRAYGATRKGIIFSFLLESTVITTLGGIAGILLSVIFGRGFEKIFDIPMVFSYRVVVFAFLFSFLTGLLAGLKPALKASRIEPIEAIRG